MSGRRKGRFNVHQLQINWNGDKALTPSVDTAVDRPVLRLRWDFKNNFPQPLPEAVDAGHLTAEDTLPDSVQAIHQEHGRRMLGALSDLDAVTDRCRNNPPVPAVVPDALTEPTRLERWYASLLGLYEEWFGREAAEAFDRAVRAWHAHVEVVVDRKPPAANIPPQPQPKVEDSPVIEAEIVEPPAVATAAPAPRLPGPVASRVVARLPLPKPLAAAVQAGHFGTDEQGNPIDPSADEVWDITVNHAEELIDLLTEQREAGRRGPEAHVARLSMDIQAAFMKYAEDFGCRAAEQLLAFARRQVLIQSRTGSRGPHVGR